MSYAGATYLSSILAAVSADLVAGLPVMGLPALTEGGIAFGPAATGDNIAPPRVVIEPVTVRFGPVEATMLSNVTTGAETGYPADLVLAWQSRPLGTAWIGLKCTCWGVADPVVGSVQDPMSDWNATDALMRAVIRSFHQVAPGANVETNGKFTMAIGEASLMRAGWVVTFNVEIPTPIVDYPLAYVPAGTTALITTPQT